MKKLLTLGLCLVMVSITGTATRCKHQAPNHRDAYESPNTIQNADQSVHPIDTSGAHR